MMDTDEGTTEDFGVVLGADKKWTLGATDSWANLSAAAAAVEAAAGGGSLESPKSGDKDPVVAAAVAALASTATKKGDDNVENDSNGDKQGGEDGRDFETVLVEHVDRVLRKKGSFPMINLYPKVCHETATHARIRGMTYPQFSDFVSACPKFHVAPPTHPGGSRVCSLASGTANHSPAAKATTTTTTTPTTTTSSTASSSSSSKSSTASSEQILLDLTKRALHKGTEVLNILYPTVCKKSQVREIRSIPFADFLDFLNRHPDVFRVSPQVNNAGMRIVSLIKAGSGGGATAITADAASPASGKEVDQSAKKPCRFGASCKHSSCKYSHPTKSQPATPTGATTTMATTTPTTGGGTAAAATTTTMTTTTTPACRYGHQCRDKNCKLTHAKRPCKYGDACTDGDCAKEHPSDGDIAEAEERLAKHILSLVAKGVNQVGIFFFFVANFFISPLPLDGNSRFKKCSILETIEGALEFALQLSQVSPRVCHYQSRQWPT